jgi:hypothetical protein
VCVPSLSLGRQTMAHPNFCDECRDILNGVAS